MINIELNNNELKDYLKKWDKKGGPKEKLGFDGLKDLFENKYSKNTDLNEVLIKCAALNDLYSVNVKYLFDVAQKIISIKNFDERIKKGDLTLVDEMKEVNNINYYSFATKYCYFSDKEKRFPIYDSYLEKVLKYFRKKKKIKFENEKLKIYKTFVDQLNYLKEIYKLDCNYEELDHYLWQLGKKYFSKK